MSSPRQKHGTETRMPTLDDAHVWIAVSAARSFNGDRYRTVEGLTAYLVKFTGQDVSREAVATCLEALIAKGRVLKVDDCYLPLKRWR